MTSQNKERHSRYYPLHHFIFYPAIFIVLCVCVYGAVTDATQRLLWSCLCFLILLVAFLALMLRQHYALGNQDRIIRLELRLRYFVLTQQRFEPVEKQLSLKQLFALRFASDDELTALIDRTLKENLTPVQIKASIRDWQADHMRV